MTTTGDNSGLDIELLRHQTPGCLRVNHLNNAGCALPPSKVTDTVVDHLHLEAMIGGYEAHADVHSRIESAYDSVAQLIGAHPDQIALLESATAAWDKAFTSIHHTRPFSAGDRILVSSSEYASNVLPIMQLVKARGVRLEFIPDDEHGCVDVAGFANLLGADVAAVAINHCPAQNGLINDVAAIGAAIRAAKSPAWYLVDACQSIGQLPVSAPAIGADFISATGRKFLRGPRGTGFLYASERALAELEPFPLDLHSATWQSGGFEPASGARRFESWEKSYAALLGLGAAVDYALACGIDAMAGRISYLAEYARAGLSSVPGIIVRDRGLQKSGIVTFTHERVDARTLVSLIRKAHINVSLSTPDYARMDFESHGIDALVRVSPHAYNTTTELDQLLMVVSGARG
ncbi:MAG: aminotransferase class V-fold PLP-dependent enzyme [Candidatus Nanopelagicales bacterium]|nr:aminotransferase class V-fold PLP-dependent enzyme [Candidatus Nanopelagicales bacterium]